MLRSVVFASIALALAAAIPVQGQPGPALPEADVRREEAAFQSALGARYMEQSCRDTVYAGWEGFPLKRCTYSLRDRRAGRKTAEVVLLDASPRQLARWVVSACAEVRHTTAASCTRRIRRHILGQSGAQFPVAGIVMEDMDGDGVQNVYVFRDGVTCRVSGITNGSSAQPTPRQIEQAMSGSVVRVGVYGRIASTTREQYRANGGTVDVGTSGNRGPAWRQVVRDLYQRAWNNDRNELIVAWARANL
jgi:endoglucanase